MNIFTKPNLGNNWKCPICHQSTEKEVVLIPIDNTQKGNICEAEQFHLDCINLNYEKELHLLYQKIWETI